MLSTGKEKGPRAAAAAAAGDHPPVHEGPLEDILIRLDDAADLARASAACTAFRGAIADPAFRRRFARLHHPPPLVALLEHQGPAARRCCRSHALHPGALHHVASTPAAGAVAGAADLSCSFLPDAGSWRVRDASGGRLLLSSRAAARLDLVVCDPLHRTFVRLPPVPDHLITAGGGKRRPRASPIFGRQWFPFLVPLPAAAEKPKPQEPEPPLQVVWLLQGGSTISAFVFSSSTREWRPIPAFCAWKREYPLSVFGRHYAHGCFYWTSCRFRSLGALKLDMSEMKLSTFGLPGVTRPFTIVEASEANLGILVVGSNSLYFYYRTMEGNSGVGEAGVCWRHSRTVPLPNTSLKYSIVGGAADGYLILQACPPQLSIAQQTTGQETRYFSLKIKTLVFEELNVSFNQQPDEFARLCIYTNFPPLLSLPSVSSNEEKTGRGMTGETSATSDGSRTISSTS